MYSEELVNTRDWIAKADELLAAASILEIDAEKYWAAISVKNGQVVGIPNRKSVQGPYFLLTAYALENYFKALLIHRNRKSLQNRLTSALPAYLKNHDLIELSRDINLTIDVTEEELLFRLTQNSIWSARYPVSTDPSAYAAMKRLKKFSDGNYYLTAYLGPKDMSRVRAFVDRLRRIVVKEIGDFKDK